MLGVDHIKQLTVHQRGEGEQSENLQDSNQRPAVMNDPGRVEDVKVFSESNQNSKDQKLVYQNRLSVLEARLERQG